MLLALNWCSKTIWLCLSHLTFLIPNDVGHCCLAYQDTVNIKYEALQLTRTRRTKPLKPSKRAMMKVSKPCVLTFRPHTQSDPETLLRSSGTHHDSPIFLNQPGLYLQIRNTPQ